MEQNFAIAAQWVLLAVISGSEAVLPAYIIGMTMARFFTRYKETLHKMRAIVFAAFTPFYFIKAGVLVSVPALGTMFGAIMLLLVVKVAAKFIGVIPATRYFQYDKRTGIYTTLLMSTGLTFGTISALYGLTNQYIDSGQYSALVAAVILSAVVPTVIAQKWFFPYQQMAEHSAETTPVKITLEESVEHGNH